MGHPVAQLDEALSHYPVGRGFDFQWGQLFNTSGRIKTEMSIRGISLV